ncbi:proteinase-activated receptor 2-like isoform X2 [Thunnus maccoyii]|uniref:proteinase-activated receptor 2-like isoform X2 n=1 Tax=Thunnus maccoyii TaxID=8240 RepID=UPI001C4CA3ED|nr:proteinase-activated receptor 2-like isoform X2 [Thunnus maccoyii]
MTLKTRWSHLFLLLCCVQTCLCQSGEYELGEYELGEYEEGQGPGDGHPRTPPPFPPSQGPGDGHPREYELVTVQLFTVLLQEGAPGLESLGGVDGNSRDSEALSNGPPLLNITVRSKDKEFLSSHLTTIFLPIIYIIVFAVGLPTNAMAIWVFLFRTKKKRPSSIYMANLALADLLFVIWVPLKISYHFNGNNWIYGEGLCKVLVAFFYSNMYCSIAFITCISVQRYWAVVHPLSEQQRDNRIPVAVSVTVWVVVWLITIPLYLYDQQVRITNFNPKILTCHDVTRESQVKIAAGYFLTMGTLGFVVPTIVCIISYILMLKALRNSMTDAAITKKRRKAVVLMITVLVMFLVCFTPSNIMLLVHYILLLGGADNHLYRFYITTLCLASLNSCIDPFVYYFISKNFRDHVKNTFLCRSERTVKRMKVSFRAPKNSQEQHTMLNSDNTQSTEC